MKIAAFWENPENFGQNLAKFSNILADFAKFCKPAPEKKNRINKISAISNEKINGAKECIV